MQCLSCPVADLTDLDSHGVIARQTGAFYKRVDYAEQFLGKLEICYFTGTAISTKMYTRKPVTLAQSS